MTTRIEHQISQPEEGMSPPSPLQTFPDITTLIAGRITRVIGGLSPEGTETAVQLFPRLGLPFPAEISNKEADEENPQFIFQLFSEAVLSTLSEEETQSFQQRSKKKDIQQDLLQELRRHITTKFELPEELSWPDIFKIFEDEIQSMIENKNTEIFPDYETYQAERIIQGAASRTTRNRVLAQRRRSSRK